MEMKDISKLNTRNAADKTYRVDFLDPTDGMPTGAYAVVVGKNSKQFEAASSRIINNAQQAKKFGKQSFSLAKEKTKNAHLFASCTLELAYLDADGKTHVKVDGAQTEEQHNQIKKAYLKYDWMASQVDEAIGTDANFLGKSETNSPSTSSNELGSTQAPEGNLAA